MTSDKSPIHETSQFTKITKKKFIKKPCEHYTRFGKKPPYRKLKPKEKKECDKLWQKNGKLRECDICRLKGITNAENLIHEHKNGDSYILHIGGIAYCNIRDGCVPCNRLEAERIKIEHLATRHALIESGVQNICSECSIPERCVQCADLGIFTDENPKYQILKVYYIDKEGNPSHKPRLICHLCRPKLADVKPTGQPAALSSLPDDPNELTPEMKVSRYNAPKALNNLASILHNDNENCINKALFHEAPQSYCGIRDIAPKTILVYYPNYVYHPGAYNKDAIFYEIKIPEVFRGEVTGKHSDTLIALYNFPPLALTRKVYAAIWYSYKAHCENCHEKGERAPDWVSFRDSHNLMTLLKTPGNPVSWDEDEDFKLINKMSPAEFNKLVLDYNKSPEGLFDQDYFDGINSI